MTYPPYYLQPFHAYSEGNLSWQAAFEVRPRAGGRAGGGGRARAGGRAGARRAGRRAGEQDGKRGTWGRAANRAGGASSGKGRGAGGGMAWGQRLACPQSHQHPQHPPWPACSQHQLQPLAPACRLSTSALQPHSSLTRARPARPPARPPAAQVEPAADVIALRVWPTEALTGEEARSRLRTNLFSALRHFYAQNGVAEPRDILDIGCSVGAWRVHFVRCACTRACVVLCVCIVCAGYVACACAGRRGGQRGRISFL